MLPWEKRGTASSAVAPALVLLGMTGGLAGLLSTDVVAQGAVDAPIANDARAFEIPAGPLSRVLSQFAGDAGVALSFDASQVSGLTSAGLSGSYTIDQGFAAILAGTGFVVVSQRNGNYTLRSGEGALLLGPVQIAGAEVMAGTAEQGYRAETVSGIGPWEERSLQDTPYSINVVSEDLIENIQATTSPDQVFKMNPVTQLTWPQYQNDYPRVFLRGFQNSSSVRNGVNMPTYVHGLIMEEVERIETLTGLSGFLYGSGNVGGLVNYVSKRPTEERLNSIRIGNTTGRNGYLHGDFGGQFDENAAFGYRINLVTQDGETYVDDQRIDRDSVSAAFDWQATDNLLVDAAFSWRDYLNHGRLPYWSLAAGVERPSVDDIDPSKNWGQEWAQHRIDTRRSEVGAVWQVAENIRIRGRFVNESNERSAIFASNTVQADNTYDQTISSGAVQELASDAGYVFVDFDLEAFSFQHTLTIGGQISEASSIIHANTVPEDVTFTGFSLNAPTYVPPAWTSYEAVPGYKTYDFGDRTFSIGDHIVFGQKWSAMVGISYSSPFLDRYDTSGNRISSYEEGTLTPSISVLFKPYGNVTTYASYIEGLERGGIAGETYGSYDVINKHEVMEPLASQQIELGAKVGLGGILLTGALYEIDKPLEYYEIINSAEAIYIQDGRQIHEGLEFTATGKLTDALTLVGGFTLLDAKVRDNEQSPELEGKAPSNVTEEMYKAYLEYDLPAVQGLTVSGGASYTGDFYGDNENTDRIGGYTLVDVGARYSTRVANRPLTFRLNVNNLLDERYWANSLFLGNGRTVALSARMTF